MQPGQYRGGDDSMAIRDSMPALPCEPVEQRVGNAGAEAAVWSTLVVVSHPLAQNGPKVPFIQQDQPIQTLTTDRADQSLAERVGLRAADRRFQHRQAQGGDRAIDGRGIDAVAVVNEKSLRLITGNHRAELLDDPFRRGVLRHIPMHDPARADFKDDKTYSVRNVAVMVTKKSQASMAPA